MGWFLPAAILGSAVIGAAGSILGSKSSSRGADKAADAQVDAALIAQETQREGMAQQREIFDIGREDVAPWREFGIKEGLEQLGPLQERYKRAVLNPSTYDQSPGYNWLQKQGVDALNRGASASGALDSGARSKDLMAYGQGLALQDYQGYLGRLESLMNRYAGSAGMGQTASGTLAGLGQTLSGQIGQGTSGIARSQIAAGQAQAGGYINQANASTGLYQNLANIGTSAVNQYAMYNYLNRSPGLQSPQNISGYEQSGPGMIGGI